MNDVPRNDVHDWIEDYAMGTLGPVQRAEFEARLAHDPALRAEVNDLIETLAAVGMSAPETPPAALKARVMARVAAGASPNAATVRPMPSRRRPRASLWLGAALAASLVLLVKVSLDLRAARQETRASVAALAVRNRDLLARDSMIAQLTDPAMQMVTLAATSPDRPVIRAYMNHARHTLILSASALETLPAGQAYQLWFIVDGKPIPSRTFTPDSGGHVLMTEVSMPAGAVAATAITREPEGGSAAPTSPVLFIAKFATE